MQIAKWVTILILLPLVSACSTISNDFLQNFTKDNQAATGSAASPVVSMKYGKEGILVVGRESGAIDVWETATSQPKREFKAHGYPANSITFTSAGDAFFSSSYFENATKLWSVKTGEQLFLVRRMNGPVGTTPNENIFVIANGDYLSLFDSKQKVLFPEKFNCGGSVKSITTDVASGLIAVGSEAGTIDVWKYSDNKGVPTMIKVASARPYQFGDWVVGLQFSSSGNSLYSVARFGSIDEWSAGTLDKRRSVPTILKYVYSAAFFRDKDLLALAGTEEKIGTGPGSVEVISLATGESRKYPVNTNLAVVEYLPPLASFIAAQKGLARVLTAPHQK